MFFKRQFRILVKDEELKAIFSKLFSLENNQKEQKMGFGGRSLMKQ